MIEESRPQARAVRGFQDRRADVLAAERRIVTAVSEVYESFGFELLETPAFEYADALGKFLPDAERPNAGVFALQDDDDQWMALRYDLTAPLARFVAENAVGLPRPFRRYAFGAVWRDEKPGPGRYRQFVQCDADTVGSARPEADAEIIAMAVAGYEAAGLAPSRYVVRVNSRKLLNGLMAAQGLGDVGQRLAVLRAVDKLDRLGAAGVVDLLGAGRLDESGAFTKGAGLKQAAIDAVVAFISARRETRSATIDALSSLVGGSAEGAAGLEELARIGQALAALGVADTAAVIDPAVVRGLEYYTGAVFEAELVGDGDGTARLGSVGGGGRYDDLVARFTGEPMPATGFSFGVSRLVEALAAAELTKRERKRGPVVVIALEAMRMADYFAAAAELRTAGIAAEVYLGESGMRAQMKYADRRASPAAVIMGEDEIAVGQVTVKDLDLGRRLAEDVADNRAWREDRPGQVTAPRAELAATVRRILDSQS
ncbi:MAG TPA: histidine--tRNA ligase [Caulobacteraceae bacterium]